MGRHREEGRTIPQSLTGLRGRDPHIPGSPEPAMDWSRQNKDESCMKACDKFRGLLILNPSPRLCSCHL